MTPNGEPACYGADPDLFEKPPGYALALTLCYRCPVRAWCLFTVDPARSSYDGVVGGYIWANGELPTRLNPSVNRTTDPTIDVYLKACNK